MATAQNYSKRIDCIIVLFMSSVLSEELKIENVKLTFNGDNGDDHECDANDPESWLRTSCDGGQVCL